MKLIIDIPEEAKQAFDCAESNDLKGCYYDHGGVIGNAIKNGTPLDNNSERAEVQAYFAGQTYGWEHGRKALIEDIKAEIKKLRSHSARFRTSSGRVVYIDSQDILDVLDNIGKESEGAND